MDKLATLRIKKGACSMDNKMTFGSFLIKKRMEQELSARQIANALGISAVYVCDIEKDRRPAPHRYAEKSASNFTDVRNRNQSHA